MPGESEIVQTFLQLVNAVAKLSFQLQLVADGKGAKSLKPQLEEGVPHPTKETVLYKAYATRVLGKALKNLEPRGSSVDRSAEEMSISGLNEQHTMIFLTCQLPPFSIVQDEQATYLFLKNLKSGGSLTIASPYFNLTSNHVNVRLLVIVSFIATHAWSVCIHITQNRPSFLPHLLLMYVWPRPRYAKESTLAAAAQILNLLCTGKRIFRGIWGCRHAASCIHTV